MHSTVKILIHSADEQKEATIAEGNFYIGRSSNVDVTIKNELLSRKHIKVKQERGRLLIQDLDTTNGTFLNAKRLDSHEWYPVRDEDEITIGINDISIKMSLEHGRSAKVYELNKKSLTLDVEEEDEIPPPELEDKTVVGANALKTEPVQNQFSRRAKEGVREIMAKAKNAESPQFSEIELLEIKKIEIESQVMALKIKEESELEAQKIIDNAIHESNHIINQAEDDSNIIIKNAKLEAEDIIIKAEDECRALEESAEKELAEMKAEKDQAVLEKNKANQKVEELHQELLDGRNQKEELLHRSFELREEIKRGEIELETLTEKNKNIYIDYENKRVQLDEDLKSLYEEVDFMDNKHDAESKKLKKLEDEKNFIQEEVETLKKREDQILSSIESGQKNLNQLQDNEKKLDLHIEQLKYQLEYTEKETQTKQNDYDKLLEAINEKESYLEGIRAEAKNLFEKENEKVSQKMQKIRAEAEIHERELKEQNKKIADDIILNANKDADKIRTEAEEFLKSVEEKELELDLQKEDFLKDSEKQAEKLNETLLKKLHEANLDAKKVKEDALAEYESTVETAKREADSLKAKTQVEVTKLKDEAQLYVDKIKDEAQKSADERIENAKNEAKEFFLSGKDELEKSQEKATEIIRLAQDKSAQIHQDGLRELETLKSKIINENKKTKEENKVLLEKKDALNSETEKLKSVLEKKKVDFAKEMKTKEETALAQIEKESERIKSEKMKALEDELAAKSKDKKQKLDQEIKKERQMIAKLRSQEMEKIKHVREKSEAEFERRRVEYSDTIVKGIQNLINGKIQQLGNKGIDKTNFVLDEEKVRYLIKSCLVDKNPEDNQMLKKLNPYGKTGKGRSTQFMKRLGIGASVVASLFILHLIFPGIYGSIGSKVGNVVAVKESAQDLYLKDLKEKEKNKPKFEPKMTDSFKETYTDNIIYTSSFSEIWPDNELQKAWTIKVDDMIVNQMGLKDYKVVDYIGIEFKLVRELTQMRKKIKLENQEEQIQEMRDFESETKESLVKLLGSERRYRRMRALQKRFFIDYRNKL